MFEVGGTYANRKGTYTVLSFNGNKMTVEYEDGETADLKIAIQERIWENMELDVGKLAASKGAKAGAAKNRFVVYSIFTDENINNIVGLSKFPLPKEIDKPLETGDRLLFYSTDAQAFIAAATVTSLNGPSKRRKEGPTISVDFDAQVQSLALGLNQSDVELDSIPNVKTELATADKAMPITEDEFETIFEILAEASEEVADDSEIQEEEEDLEE